MKRIVLGLAALGAVAATAAPASAGVYVDYCYRTIVYPCAVCFDGPVWTCVPIAD